MPNLEHEAARQLAGYRPPQGASESGQAARKARNGAGCTANQAAA